MTFPFSVSIAFFLVSFFVTTLVFNGPCCDVQGRTPAVLPKPLGEA